jgi:hypothetical protein
MKYNFIYIFVFFAIFFLIMKKQNKKEKYQAEQSIQSIGQTKNDGPWGSIGTDRPWYDYPYVLHNIEY